MRVGAVEWEMDPMSAAYKPSFCIQWQFLGAGHFDARSRAAYALAAGVWLTSLWVDRIASVLGLGLGDVRHLKLRDHRRRMKRAAGPELAAMVSWSMPTQRNI